MENGKFDTLEEFAEELRKRVKKVLGDDRRVEVCEILKNNDTTYTCLSIGDERAVASPIIYLDRLYHRYQKGYGDNIPTIVKSIIEICENSKGDDFDLSIIESFEKAKEKICYRLVNKDRNKRFLEAVPHIDMCGDLVAIFYVLLQIDSDDGIASIKVTNELIDQWGVTVDDLYKLAKKNTQEYFPGIIKSIHRMMLDTYGDNMDENSRAFLEMADSGDIYDDCLLYVCTNKYMHHGAAVIFFDGFLKEFSDKTECDYFIIPSSIHEVLIAPVGEQICLDNLKSMVVEVNANSVPETEILSDTIYMYRRETDSIEIASEEV